MSPSAPSLYLVDASAYVYRAFHAVPPLTSRSGLPTNATYGFTNMLLRLLREERPDRVALVFDAGGPTFRDEIYDGYKAHREPTPDDLLAQLPWIRQVIDRLRLPVLEVAGVEADDVIASLVAAFADRCREIVIVSGDKDLMQLVAPNVVLYDSMWERRFDESAVTRKFGVPPAQVAEVLALMGDKIDDVPGVAGIGEKSAQALIAAFGSVGGLYERLGEVDALPLRGAKRIRALLEGGREAAELSLELVRLRRDVPLELEFEDLRAGTPDAARLRALFTDLGFQSLAAELAPAEARPSGTTGWVEDRATLAALLPTLVALPSLSVETWEREDGGIGGIAFGVAPDEACAVRLDREGGPALADLRDLLEAGTPEKTAGDGKRTLLGLAREGIALGGLTFDVGLASYVDNPARPSHRAEDVAAELFGAAPATFFDDPAEVAAERARLDLRLAETLAGRLSGEALAPLFREIEMPLVAVLARMERRGVRLDVERLAVLATELETRIAALLREIHELAGGAFNVGSPRELREVLFDRLKISARGVRRGRAGLPTDVDVLTRLQSEHPLPERILAYRGLAELKTSTVDALPALVDPRSGRVHASFGQTVAATGRLSSSEPDLQKIPIRTAEGRRIRAAFVPEEGFRLVAADYSQIELRLLAHLSGDELLRECFRRGEDVHARTAAELHGVAPRDVTAEQRQAAKTLHFGILDGMDAARLARELALSTDRAGVVMSDYFARHPGVSDYLRRSVEEARRSGAARTLFGRRRPIPDLAGRAGGVRQFAERVAMHTPIQGSAADLIKRAMIAIDRRLLDEVPRAAMILQVHDELVFEAPEADAERVAVLVRKEMEEAVELAVPLEVAVTVGDDWASLH